MSLMRLGRMSVVSLRSPMMQADDVGPGGVAPPASPDRVDGLTKYIPVETITLFVAALSIIGAIESIGLSKWHVYAFCAALTPAIVWLAAVGQHVKAKVQGDWPFPWWRMLAATIAFLVWSLSIEPMLSPALRPLAGFGALLISTLLTLGDPLLDGRTFDPTQS